VLSIVCSFGWVPGKTRSCLLSNPSENANSTESVPPAGGVGERDKREIGAGKAGSDAGIALRVGAICFRSVSPKGEVKMRQARQQKMLKKTQLNLG